MTASPDSLLGRTLASITPIDADAVAAAQARQLTLTKPPAALGQLESIGNQLAGIYGTCPPPVPEPALTVVFAGDHGVWAQGVSPWPQEVTVQMAANILTGGAAMNVLSRHAGADVLLYDLGMKGDPPASELLRTHKVARGTADLAQGPAMSPEQCQQAIEVGITAASDAVAAGYRVLVAGEVGIGNTTPAAALIAVMTRRSASEVTGSGAGAVGEALENKKRIVAQGIEVNGASADDPLGALAAVGGFEHAAMVGFALGAAAARVPLIVDGVIACSAALVAVALCPEVRGFLIAGHDGREPGIAAALDVLELEPVVALDMRLGEGTGALSALPIVQSSAKILREMATFESAAVSEGL